VIVQISQVLDQGKEALKVRGYQIEKGGLWTLALIF
jgi:hypothetical protein